MRYNSYKYLMGSFCDMGFWSSFILFYCFLHFFFIVLSSSLFPTQIIISYFLPTMAATVTKYHILNIIGGIFLKLLYLIHIHRFMAFPPKLFHNAPVLPCPYVQMHEYKLLISPVLTVWQLPHYKYGWCHYVSAAYKAMSLHPKNQNRHMLP